MKQTALDRQPRRPDVPAVDPANDAIFAARAALGTRVLDA